MISVRARARTTTVIAGLVLASGTGVAAAAHVTTAAAQPKVTTAVAERLVAQQGLLIGLASNVLQSQMILDEDLYPNSVDDCRSLDGGGSQNVTAATQKGNVTTGTNIIYYGDTCTKPYMTQKATITVSSGSAPVSTIKATNTYVGPTGKKLGTMTTRATEQAPNDHTVLLNGLGTFHVTGLKSPLTLGLACKVAETTKLEADCQGGAAQDFPSLHASLGSVTPVVVTVTRQSAPVANFTAKTATRRVGAIGALTIGAGKPQTLSLHGSGTNAGGVTVKGRAGNFVLFPPEPTGWTIVDKAHHVSFTIALENNTSRTLAGSVNSTAKGHRKLAAFSVDQSGTGSMSYVGGKKVAITGWALTG